MGTLQWLLVTLHIFAYLIVAPSQTAAAPKQNKNDCDQEGGLRLRGDSQNSTCGYVEGRVEVCNGGSWKTICDRTWTVEDAQVACRQLNYSSEGASVLEIVTVSIENPASFAPVCTGTEPNITSCTFTVSDASVQNLCTYNPGVLCFLEDSSVELCFGSITNTTASTEFTPTTEREDSTQPSSTNSTTSGSSTVTDKATSPTLFTLVSPAGVAVVAVIASVVVLAIVLLVVIIVLVCRRTPTSKREVSPRTVEHSFKDSEGKPGLFEGSPGQSRHTLGNVDIPEHHFIEQEGPLYEQVKEAIAAPPSVSSHDSGRSTTTSETNLPPNYSTLEQSEMPTYSTLERSQSDYAQVQPYINGSLPRGATSTADLPMDNEDHYHVLNRNTSQTSSFSRAPSASSSPKNRTKANSSPKQVRGYLPSITDDVEEIPDYAQLDTPVNGDVSLTATTNGIPPKLSPDLPARRSPGQYRHHSSSMSGRPQTHERISPKLKKSSTLPNTGRAGPSKPQTKRWSGNLEPSEHSNGSRTLLEARGLGGSNHERIANSSWV